MGIRPDAIEKHRGPKRSTHIPGLLPLDHPQTSPYNANLTCRSGGMVDTSVSKTDAFRACRFESGLRYQKTGRARNLDGFGPLFVSAAARVRLTLLMARPVSSSIQGLSAQSFPDSARIPASKP